MQKSLLVTLLFAALLTTACERRPIVTLHNPLDDMEAEARREWTTAAQGASPAADTVYKSAEDPQGHTLDIAYHLPSQTALVDWKGQTLHLPQQAAGAELVYADDSHRLRVTLDSIHLQRKGKTLFAATVPPHTWSAKAEDGRVLQLAEGAFADRVRVVLGTDTLYLDEQQGLIKSKRYHDAHYSYADILGTHILEKDGQVLFSGKTVHTDMGGNGYHVREGGKKFIKRVFTPHR